MNKQSVFNNNKTDKDKAIKQRVLNKIHQVDHHKEHCMRDEIKVNIEGEVVTKQID